VFNVVLFANSLAYRLPVIHALSSVYPQLVLVYATDKKGEGRRGKREEKTNSS
jgi:hypothetical protein